MLGLGILTSYCLGAVLYWRIVAIIPPIVNLLLILALWRIPESPLWLLSHRGTEECREALQWLRYSMVYFILLSIVMFLGELRMSVWRSVRYRRQRNNKIMDSL